MASLLPAAERRLAAQHGTVPGGAFVVLGLGKLGSHELTVGSDLDLVFVYDAPADAQSDGARPLPAATYYARLGQRLVSNLSAKTAEGQLYEIDMRLRPSGNAGPVATTAWNFARYHAETAQPWEQQALTRARVVAGDAALAERVEAGIWANLARPREVPALGRAIRAMRERIFKEHGSDVAWNLKHARGGHGRDRVRGPAPQARPRPRLPGPAPHRHARDPGGRSREESLLPADQVAGAGPRPRPAPGPPGRAAPVDRASGSTPRRHRRACSRPWSARPPWRSRASRRRPISPPSSGALLKASARCAKSSTSCARRERDRRGHRTDRGTQHERAEPRRSGPGLRPARRRRRTHHLGLARGQALRDLLLPQGRHARLHQGGHRLLLHLRPVQGRRRRADRRLQGQRGQPRQVQEEARASSSRWARTPRAAWSRPSAPGSRRACTARNTWASTARPSWSARMGKIARIWRKVSVPGHVEEVLEAAKGLSK